MAKQRSKDNTAINIDALIKERNRLMLEGKDYSKPQKQIDWIYYGIK